MPQQSHCKGRKREPRERRRGDRGREGKGGVEGSEKERKVKGGEHEGTQSRAGRAGEEEQRWAREKKRKHTHHHYRPVSTRTDNMTPRTGTSRAEWCTAPGLDPPGEWTQCHGLKNPGPGRSHTATGPPGLDYPGRRRDKRTSARSPDWSIRGTMYRLATGPPGLEHPGGRNPGLEHPGKKRVALDWDPPALHKEEEAAAARRSGRAVKDNMNKSKERDHVEGRGEEELDQ